MNKRLFIIIGGVILIVVILIVAFLSGKNKPNTSAVTLTVWLPYDEGKAFQDVSKDFLDQNSNVKLDFKFVDANDAKEYESKVVNDIANGNGPDIWLVRSDWIPKHVGKSVAAIAEDKNPDPIADAKSTLIPALVDLNTYQNKLYGLPVYADSLAVIYNSDFLDDVSRRANDDQKTIIDGNPLSWDELKTLAQTVGSIKTADGNSSAIALGTVSNTVAPVDVLSAFLLQAKVNLYDAELSSVEFNLAQFKNGQPDVPAVDALNFYTSFARSGQKNNSWSVNSGDPTQAFLDGKTAALIGYESNLRKIVAAKPKFNLNVGALPQKDTGQARIDFAVTWSMIVNARSTNTQFAWNYLWYLASAQNQTALAQSLGKLPASSNGVDDQVSKDKADASSSDSIFRSQFYSAGKLVKPEWQFVDEVLQDSINQIVVNNQSFQTTVDSAAARLKTLIAK